MQPEVRPAVKSPPLSKVANLKAKIIEKMFEFTSGSAPDRDQRRFEPLRVQSSGYVNGNAFGATGSHHGNDMDYFNLLHGVSLSSRWKFLFVDLGAAHERTILTTTISAKPVLDSPQCRERPPVR